MDVRIIEAMCEAGYVPYTYSGRGMYGQSCVAINVSNGYEAIADIYHNLSGEEVLDEFMDMVRRTREDSMGTGRVIYWPGQPWVDEYLEIVEKYHGPDEEEDY